MNYIEYNKKLTIKIIKDDVLSSLGCKKDDIFYESVSNQFDALFLPAVNSLNISYTASCDNDNIFITLSAGSKISEFADSYFQKGEAMAALIINAIADEALFKADSIISERIKYYCANEGKGIKERLEAPASLPLNDQVDIVNHAPLDNLTLTDAFMLSPVKSMCYKLVLTNDKNIFKAQHDCSKCSNLNCPRRMKDAEKQFTVTADFDYTPSLATGVAIDIGTTTIAAALYENGVKKNSLNETNLQRRFGADVLSRVEAYNSGRKSEIKSIIEYQLKRIIQELNAENKPVIAAGNTAMVSFLMGYNCDKLGIYPFEAECLDSVKTTNGIKLVSCISPFIGGDISSGLYMLDFHKQNDTNMLIDIGTNGEMAIGNKNGIICTSTAAGPAFEGGGISCGVGSVNGAVYSVSLKNRDIRTINNDKAIGICGTGIVELCAELLKLGYMDNTGKLSDDFNGEFQLTKNIVFTQKDIRAFQTAKSAIRTGIDILISESGIDPVSIKKIYIAGGFGKNLNIKKACEVGLLPLEFYDKYKPVGNSSLGGCVKLLEHENGFSDIEHIRNISEVFSLAEHKNFSELFLNHMYFSY